MNETEIMQEITNPMITTIVLWLAGLAVLAIWALKTSFGSKALIGSPSRRNNMPFYLPLVPIFVCYGASSVAVEILDKFLGDIAGWKKEFLNNAIVTIAAIGTIILILFLARSSFSRRLKGFGLNFKTIGKDIWWAFVNLFSVWPLIVSMILVVTVLGEFFGGPDFKFQRHEELELLSAHSELPLIIVTVFLAVVVAPLVEEMIFRGMLQTVIRSYSGKPWLAIMITSAFFAVVHAEPGHWPALFALSMSMGYAYEKSGSLFRSIFIHAMFNATSIIGVLTQ